MSIDYRKELSLLSRVRFRKWEDNEDIVISIDRSINSMSIIMRRRNVIKRM